MSRKSSLTFLRPSMTNLRYLPPIRNHKRLQLSSNPTATLALFPNRESGMNSAALPVPRAPCEAHSRRAAVSVEVYHGAAASAVLIALKFHESLLLKLKASK